MGSILSEIETTISEGTYNMWFPEFLELIDEENIESDYHLVYRSFTRDEFMSRNYNFPDFGVWEWLIKEDIIKYDLYQDHEEPITKSDNEPFRYKMDLYCFTNKFFDCYQKYHIGKARNDFSYWFYNHYAAALTTIDSQRKNYRYYFDK